MNALEYAKELIRFDSTSNRSNAEISDYVQQVLKQLGCETERIEYDDAGVLKSNVVARKGHGAGGLAWFGHTDVVPSTDWSIAEHGPFEPTVRDGRLYGRGSTDMKGPMACMLAAVAAIGEQTLSQPVYICCSSDEEIDHRGANEVIARSNIYRQLIEGGAVGIVGEPTQLDVVYAHKGGVQIFVTSRGIAAHSSTREGRNANMAMIPFLFELKSLCEETESDPKWLDDEFDPPSVCANLGINDNNGAINITSPQSVCSMLLRTMPSTNVDSLIDRIRQMASRHNLEFELRTRNPPFRRDPRTDFVKKCEQLASGNSARTVSFGTEAAQFEEIQKLVVMGPGDIAQAHKSDEWISLQQLEQGQQVYSRLLDHFCLSPNETVSSEM